MREQKGRPQIERKYLQITYLQRTDSYPEYIKNFPNPFIRKQSDFLNGQEFEQPLHQKKKKKMANKHIKRCLTSLVIRERQINNTVTFQSTRIRTAKIKNKKQTISSAGEDGKRLKL